MYYVGNLGQPRRHIKGVVNDVMILLLIVSVIVVIMAKVELVSVCLFGGQLGPFQGTF